MRSSASSAWSSPASSCSRRSRGSPWLETLAFVFGSGAALTLDEFALILHLEDVYWTGEGRKSIDAIILGVTFITLLLTGLLPRTFNEVGDYITISRWVGSVFILFGAFFVVLCYLKGKLFVGTVGIFVPPVALVGALAGEARLAVAAAIRRQPGQARTRPATRASTRSGSGASIACGTSSAVSRTSRCRTGTATATGTIAAGATARPAARASRTSRAVGPSRPRLVPLAREVPRGHGRLALSDAARAARDAR